MSAAAEQPQKINIWWLFLTQASVGSLVGITVLTMSATTVLVLIEVVGLYWFMTGIVALARFFVDRSRPWIWSVLTGIVGILTGLLMVIYPLLAGLTSPTMVIIIFGVQGLIMGLLGIIDGFAGIRIGSFIVGLINALIALVLFISSMAPMIVLTIAFGVLLIVQSAALAICALRIGSPRQA
jgi:uncharacterized membrane protein HdeD (DUF308 family)